MKKDEYEFIAHTPRGAVERSALAKHAWQMRLTNTNMCMHILAQTCTETVPINYYQAWPNAFGLVLIKVSPDYVCVFFIVVIYLRRAIICILFGSMFIFFMP